MFVLFAVRNKLVERQRLMVQREEENGKVLRSHLTPVKSPGASEGTYLESRYQEEKQGTWTHTKVGK